MTEKLAPGLWISVTLNYVGNLCLKSISLLRYGENVIEANQNPDWICPVCRGICNCSLCHMGKGWMPTGNLYRKVSSIYPVYVHEYELSPFILSKQLIIFYHSSSYACSDGCLFPFTKKGVLVFLSSISGVWYDARTQLQI